MKIGNEFTAVVTTRQSEPKRGSAKSNATSTGSGIRDNVDVSGAGYSTPASAVTSLNQAMDLIQGIDFRKAVDVCNIPGDTASRLANLIQS